MNTIEIQYCFKLGEHTKEIFNLAFDEQKIELLHNTPEDLPYWASLDFHKCPHCQLNVSTHPNCPVAVNLVDIAMRFDNIVSYDEIAWLPAWIGNLGRSSCRAQEGTSMNMDNRSSNFTLCRVRNAH